MVFKECVNGNLLDVTKEFHRKLTIINNTLLEHSNKLNNPIPQHSERELNALRKENLELKEQNSCLNERMNKLSYIVKLAYLQDKTKRAEDEKNSLITTMRLLHNDAIINHSLNDSELRTNDKSLNTIAASDDANTVYSSVIDDNYILTPNDQSNAANQDALIIIIN